MHKTCAHCGQVVHVAPDHLGLPDGTLVHARSLNVRCADGKGEAEVRQG